VFARCEKKIQEWWLTLDQTSTKNLLQKSCCLFVDLFDTIYGRNPWTWRCAWRSALSIFAVTLLTLVVESISPGYIWHSQAPHVLALVGPLTLLAGNLLADYLSLLETRFLLRWCRDRGLMATLVALIVDIPLSITCYVFVAGGSFGLLTGNWLFFDDLDDLVSQFTEVQYATSLVYSTFFTSFLFYLFAITSLVFRVLLVLRVPLRAFLGWLASYENPVKTVAALAASIVVILKGIQELLVP